MLLPAKRSVYLIQWQRVRTNPYIIESCTNNKVDVLATRAEDADDAYGVYPRIKRGEDADDAYGVYPKVKRAEDADDAYGVYPRGEDADDAYGVYPRIKRAEDADDA